jgi:glycosyltransferase involved in cell wall biosynthesis
VNPPRIAYCSPVNPAPTGISDYSEELLPYLAQYGDITLYLEESLRPTNPQPGRFLEVRPLRQLPAAQRRRPYDAILYHMGNSPAHAAIWRAAQQVPGVIVMHDFVLHHFLLWYAANVERNVQHYVTHMVSHYGEEGHHVAQLMARGQFTDAAFRFPCCEQVVAAARAIFCHNRYVQQRVRVMRPEVPTAVVPMGVPLSPLIGRDEARAHLGLPPHTLLLASFGHINAYKRLEPALRALLALRTHHPDIRYILVGSVSPNYDAAALIERMGLHEAVTLTGYVDHHQFERYVAAADICLNLRYPTAGETSASLLRLLGAGRPTLVSSTGSFAELPPGVAAQVDVGPAEADLIAVYCRLLTARPEAATALGANARAYIAQQHTLERSAASYAHALADVYGWKCAARVREAPLWEPALDRWQPSSSTAKPHPDPANRATHYDEQGEQETTAPTLPAGSLLFPHIARRMAEIGASEHHNTLLQTVARHMRDLGEKE